MNEQVMPRINGITFHCEDCGCNVFTEYEPYRYRCNGCGSCYVGEPVEMDKDAAVLKDR